MTHLNKYLAIGTAAAIVASASTFAVAAPIGSGQLALKEAAASDVIEVSRRSRRNTAIALGVLGGIAVGSAMAHGSRHHYSDPYYYAPPPSPHCWVQAGPYRGQGYWAHC